MSDQNTNTNQNKEQTKIEKIHDIATTVVIPVATGIFTVAGIVIKFLADKNKRQ